MVRCTGDRLSSLPTVKNSQKFATIGYSSGQHVKVINSSSPEPNGRLQIKRKKEELSKGRNRYRRNTIAVNLIDVEAAKDVTNLLQQQYDVAKSYDHIDQVDAIDKYRGTNYNRASMPSNNLILNYIFLLLIH